MNRRPRGKRIVDVVAGRRIATEEFKPWPADAVLVGGAVRDALLGRQPTDFDWLVADPAAAARELAAVHDGSVFPLDEGRGHWRVLLGSVDSDGNTLASSASASSAAASSERVVHDFVPFKSSDNVQDDDQNDRSEMSTADLENALLRDLSRRDLTINAMALRRNGDLVDPTGGLADLSNGLVRMTSEAALRADPVRPLRAVRFAGTLGFEFDEATRTTVVEQAAAQLAGSARSPAPERVRDELLAIVHSDGAARTLLLAAELELLATFLPELHATRGVEQGQLHHLDVFGHSLDALQRLVIGFPDAGTALRLATLLHDVGKPPTTARHWTGRPTFHGHDRVGAELTTQALRRLRFGNDVVAATAALVREHMAPLPGSDKGARRFVHRHRRTLPDLLRLMIADREAARGRRASEPGRRAYRLALARVIAVIEEEPPAARLLSGTEVMALLSLSPGPKVGEALALLDEAVAVGDVRDRGEAVAYLERYARAQGWAEASAEDGSENGSENRRSGGN